MAAISQLKYLKLDYASKILCCDVDNIIHFGAHGIIRIGLPYRVDSFCPDKIFINSNNEMKYELVEMVEDYKGFAFLDSGYLLDCEMYEKCKFTSLTLEDGRIIIFEPKDDSSHWKQFVLNGMDKGNLYLLQEDYKKLKSHLNSKTVEQPIKDTERRTMIKIIHSLAKNGYKYPSHGSLKDMLIDFERNENGVSEKTLKKYLDEFSSL